MCYGCTYSSCELLGKISEVHTNSYLVNPVFRMWCCATGWVFPHILKYHVTLKIKTLWSLETRRYSWSTMQRDIPEDLDIQQHYCENLKSQILIHCRNTKRLQINAVNSLCSAAGWQPTQHTFSGQDTSQFNTLKGVETNVKRKIHLKPINKTTERAGHCRWQTKTQNRACNNALCTVSISLCHWVR